MHDSIQSLWINQVYTCRSPEALFLALPRWSCRETQHTLWLKAYYYTDCWDCGRVCIYWCSCYTEGEARRRTAIGIGCTSRWYELRPCANFSFIFVSGSLLLPVLLSLLISVAASMRADCLVAFLSDTYPTTMACQSQPCFVYHLTFNS